MEQVSSAKRKRHQSFPPRTVGGHSQQAAVCRAGGLPPAPSGAGTLPLDLPACGRDRLCLSFQLPSLWCLGMTAWVD